MNVRWPALRRPWVDRPWVGRDSNYISQTPPHFHWSALGRPGSPNPEGGGQHILKIGTAPSNSVQDETCDLHVL